MINLRRTYLIARRDYVGYIKTWGFWISFFLPFVFGFLGFLLTSLDIDVKPTRYETVLDETGRYAQDMLSEVETERRMIERAMIRDVSRMILPSEKAVQSLDIYETQGFEAAKTYLDEQIPGAGKRLRVPGRKTVYVPTPAQTMAGLKPYLLGQTPVMYDGQAVTLNGVLHIFEQDGKLNANYWSEHFNNQTVQSMARDYFRNRASEDYLAQGGLTVPGLKAAQEGTIKVESFDPTKTQTDDASSQAVTNIDRIPYIVSAVFAVILWLAVFSGSYMLLTSMLEEKLNKLLEMMLASTRFSEIMFGKLIGVAALTLTAMLPYILVGIATVVGFILFGDPDVSAGLQDALSAKLLIFFFIFLVFGYLFYGAFFIALGAMAESMQDAQTLTTPIVLVLTLCVMVVPLGLESPDSPLLVFASWFPLSAPFAAIVRLPSDPPLWELAVSASFVAVCAIGVIWVAGRIFRYGVLSGSGVKGLKGWFMHRILRRPTGQ